MTHFARCAFSQLSLLYSFFLDISLLHFQLEKKEISWERYVDLSPSDLGELVRAPKLGKQIHRLIHSVPRVELAAHVQPITRSLLRVDLTVTPDFQYDVKVGACARRGHLACGQRTWHVIDFSTEIPRLRL